MLVDMASAYKNRTFSGRFIYMYGADINTLMLKHAVIDGRRYEHLAHLDGRAAQLIRAGGEAVCIHPDKTVTRLPEGKGLFDVHQKVMGDVPEQYKVLFDGEGRVAARPAWRIRLSPLDSHRYGYRLWVDHESRLLLKSEMVNADQVPLERMEFITLDLSPQLGLEDFPMPSVTDTSSSTRALASGGEDAGLTVRPQWLPGGFVEAARDRRQSRDKAMAAVTYSDGLATFTLFLEAAGAGDVSESVTRIGPTVAASRQLSHEGAAFVVTLVGEIPQATAERILDKARVEIPDA
jgi:sigma-E factor negative regulatory protein RseB